VVFAYNNIDYPDTLQIRMRTLHSGTEEFLTLYNTQQKGYQMQTFGPFYVQNNDEHQIDFYELVANSSGVYFDNFYTTDAVEDSYAGNHYMWWWPLTESVLNRYWNGIYWSAHKFTSFVRDYVRNPSSYYDVYDPEKEEVKNFAIDGRLPLDPIFYKNYIIVYQSFSTGTGKLSVFKYHPQFQYLEPQSIELTFTESSPAFHKTSLAYFGEEGGIIFKASFNDLIWRFDVQNDFN